MFLLLLFLLALPVIAVLAVFAAPVLVLLAVLAVPVIALVSVFAGPVIGFEDLETALARWHIPSLGDTGQDALVFAGIVVVMAAILGGLAYAIRLRALRARESTITQPATSVRQQNIPKTRQ